MGEASDSSSSPDTTSNDSAESEHDQEGKVEFPAPEGMKVPEEGKTKMGRCSYTSKEGMICLVEIDGHKLPGYEEHGGSDGDGHDSEGASDSDSDIEAMGMGQE